MCTVRDVEAGVLSTGMVTHIARVWINQVRLPVLHDVVSLTQKWKFPCPRSCLRILSRETGLAVPSRVSLLISILEGESGAYS